MARRLATVLLSAALVVAAVLAGPCAFGSTCAMARQMDCCHHVQTGISSPRCCGGEQQISRGTTPATSDRPTQRTSLAPVLQFEPVMAVAHRARPLGMQQSHTRPAPPGGSLLAQSTSLLL